MRAGGAFLPARARAGSPGTSLSIRKVIKVTPTSTMTSWNKRRMMYEVKPLPSRAPAISRVDGNHWSCLARRSAARPRTASHQRVDSTQSPVAGQPFRELLDPHLPHVDQHVGVVAEPADPVVGDAEVAVRVHRDAGSIGEDELLRLVVQVVPLRVVDRAPRLLVQLVDLRVAVAAVAAVLATVGGEQVDEVVHRRVVGDPAHAEQTRLAVLA